MQEVSSVIVIVVVYEFEHFFLLLLPVQGRKLALISAFLRRESARFLDFYSNCRGFCTHFCQFIFSLFFLFFFSVISSSSARRRLMISRQASNSLDYIRLPTKIYKVNMNGEKDVRFVACSWHRVMDTAREWWLIMRNCDLSCGFFIVWKREGERGLRDRQRVWTVDKKLAVNVFGNLQIFLSSFW